MDKTPALDLTEHRQSTASDAPLYKKVVSILRDEIVRGEFPIGSLLPTEIELCARFNISRHTVREALRELRAQGLVTSRRGSGTTVIPPSEAPHTYVHQSGSFDELSQYVGHRWDILSSEMVTLDDALAERIDSDRDTRWVRIHALRYQQDDTAPPCWTEVYLHSDYAQAARLIGKQQRAMYELIQDLYGIHINEATQTIRGIEAPDHVAKALKLKKRSVVIEVERIYRLADGKVIEVSYNLYPVTQFQFSIKLRRAPASL